MFTRIVFAAIAVFLALGCFALALGTLAGHPSQPALVLERALTTAGFGEYSGILSAVALVLAGISIGLLAPLAVHGNWSDPGEGD